MLTERQDRILQFIVSEYIATAKPVGSAYIASRYGLGVSPATIRNEMAHLENGGYISRKHISGGGVPSDKGYRHYVRTLAFDDAVPTEEHLMLSHLFHQVERELEEWTHLAAAMLSRMVNSVAVVTSPRADSCHLKHIELVALRDYLALLVLLFHEARLRQQLLAFDRPISQHELDVIGNEMNNIYSDLTWDQIVDHGAYLTSVQQQVRDTIVQLMASEDRNQYLNPYIEGVRLMLTQPEFERRRDALNIMEILESKEMVSTLLPGIPSDQGVNVVIGEENSEEALKMCSLVITQYGVPGKVSGVVGVIGPTRMQYRRAISAVRCISSLLSDLIAEIYSGMDSR